MMNEVLFDIDIKVFLVANRHYDGEMQILSEISHAVNHTYCIQ